VAKRSVLKRFQLVIDFLMRNLGLVKIRPFGTNPGKLKLMFFDPGNITEKAPLVVIFHGCSQMTKGCAEQTG
jgi:poly(3-hydroxybutyrate) depolymerase